MQKKNSPINGYRNFMRKRKGCRVLSWMLVISLLFADQAPVYAAQLPETAALDVSAISGSDVSVSDVTVPDVSVSDENAGTEPFGKVLDSGRECGLLWEITSDEKLIISGTQQDHTKITEKGWSKYNEYITKVIIRAENVSSTAWWFSSFRQLTEVDLTAFDASKVTDMSGMFSYCNALKTIAFPELNTAQVSSISKMFLNDEKLETADLSGLDLSGVKDMSQVFSGCKKLTKAGLPEIATSKITDLSGLFTMCAALTEADLSRIDASQVTTMSDMFNSCTSLTSVQLSGSKHEKLTDVSSLFYDCRALETLDLSGFDTSSVTDMSGMFQNCYKLKKLNLTGFQTANVTNMSRMFKICPELETLDVSSFDTSNVTDMSGMFCSCRMLTSLDLSHFDTSAVTNMSAMFDECWALETLDVTCFDTAKVTDMSYMFSECMELTALDVTSFDTAGVTDMSYMFYHCFYLKELDFTGFDVSQVKSMYRILSGCEELVTIGAFRNLKLTVSLPLEVMYDEEGETHTEFPLKLTEGIYLHKEKVAPTDPITRMTDFYLKVCDENTKEPVQGITVVIGQQKFVTGTDGSVRFTGNRKQSVKAVLCGKGYETQTTVLKLSELYTTVFLKRQLEPDIVSPRIMTDIKLDQSVTLGKKEIQWLNLKKQTELVFPGYKEGTEEVSVTVRYDSEMGTAQITFGVENTGLYDGAARYAAVKNLVEDGTDNSRELEKCIEEGILVTKEAFGTGTRTGIIGYLTLDLSTDTILESGALAVVAEKELDAAGKGLVCLQGTIGVFDADNAGLKLEFGDGTLTFSSTLKLQRNLKAALSEQAGAYTTTLFADVVYTEEIGIPWKEDRQNIRTSVEGTPYGETHLFFRQTITGDGPSVTQDLSRDYEVYPYGEPEMCRLENGTILAVWVTDLKEKSDANRTTLVYAVNEGNGFGPARSVCATARADFAPSLAVYGNQAFLTYVTMDQEMEQGADAQDYLDHMDVYGAVYENGSFSIPECISEHQNQTMEWNPQAVAWEGERSVVWVENDRNDPFLEENGNRICVSRYQNGTWVKEVLCEGLFRVTSLSAAYVDGELTVTYIVDSGSDTSSGEVYLWADGEQSRLTSNHRQESDVQMVGESIYWICGGQVMTMEIGNIAGTSSTGMKDVLDFLVVEDGAGIVFVRQNGLRSELYYSRKEKGTFQDPLPVTDYGNAIAGYSAALRTDGTLAALIFEREVTEAEEIPFGSTSLHLEDGLATLSKTEEASGSLQLSEETEGALADIALQNVGCSYEEENTVLNATVENQGKQDADNVTVKVYAPNSQGELLTTIFCDRLVSGETRNIRYVIPEEYLQFGDAFEKRYFYIVCETDSPEEHYGNQSGIAKASPVRVTGLTMDKDQATFAAHTMNSVTAAILPATAMEQTITWISDRPEVAVVSGNQHVIACAEGTATLYAISGDGMFIKSMAITVTAPGEEAPLYQTGSRWVTLETGETRQLVLTDAGSGEETLAVADTVWSSTDPEVAEVSAEGTVVAKKAGTAYILCSAASGTYYNAYCVQVTDDGLKALDFTQSRIEMKPGESRKQSPECYPAKAAENLNLQWSSSNPEIAEVSADGTVTAMDQGTAVITAAAWESNDVPQISSDKVFAQYKVVVGAETNYQVIFDNLLGDEPVIRTDIVPGTSVELPEQPVREDYQFLGWYTEENGGGTCFTEQTPVEENLRLYAFWQYIAKEPGVKKGLWVEEVAPQTYTGKAIKPAVRVYDGKVLLQEKTDYTISYKNNIKANDASDEKTAPVILVTGKGNYAGKESISFQINPKSLSDLDVLDNELVKLSNGKEQKPVPVLTYGGKKLVQNKDFVTEYPDVSQGAYQDPGIYPIVVKGIGNFTGEKTLELQITDKILISKVKVSAIPRQLYTGQPVEPQPLVSYKGQILAAGEDYELSYENHIEIGKASVKITGKGDYAGSRTLSFQIAGQPISKAVVSGLENRTYNGREQYQNLTLTWNGTILEEGKDYEITYANHLHAGTAKLTIAGKGGYTGTIKKTFKITAYDLGQDPGQLLMGIPQDLTVSYTKGGAAPKLSLLFDHTTLTEKKDYTLSYKNNKKPAAATDLKGPVMILKGKGDFKGTREIPFSITTRNVADGSASLRITVADVLYSEKPGKFMSKPVLTDSNGKKLTAGTDYEKIVIYRNAEEQVLDKSAVPGAGEILTVTVTGKGYYTGTLTGTFRVSENLISKTTVSIAAQSYTGSEIKLAPEAITVKAGKTILEYGEDYVILEDSYQNNLRTGTAQVTIKGIGAYGGEKTVKFKITGKPFWWFWRKDGV